MKKYICILLLSLIVVSACEDSSSLLDPAVTTGIPVGEVFQKAEYAERNLSDIYDQLLPVLSISAAGTRWRSPDVYLEATTDNGHAEAQWGRSNAFNLGAWSASYGSFSNDDWDMYWKAIRACYKFINNIDKVPNDAQYNYDDKKRAVRKAEARFLLAWNYAELVKEFGGVPLLTSEVNDISPSNELLTLPRETYDTCVQFILDQCDEAAEVLPKEWTGVDYGRVTKGAALALKSRVLLFAASPLWNNPEKPEDSPFRGAYNKNKWELAARAAAQVLEMTDVYDLLPIEEVFLTRVNKEFIFARMQQPQSYVTGLSFPPAFYKQVSFGNGGLNQVTYNMIKEYEILKDGKAYEITDEASGYDPQNPYKNRDPRFYRDCLYNGSKVLDKVADFGVSGDGVAHKGTYNDSYEGPMDTYVYSIKFADPTLKINWQTSLWYYGEGVAANYPYMRFAEIYMNYAEAMNEAFGPEVDGLGNGKTALWALNKVRTRASYPEDPKYTNYQGLKGSMPPVPSGLSQDEMRDRIRKERRIEFSYEEFRFWDVRRWKIPVEELVEIYAQIPTWYMVDGERQVRYKIVKTETRGMDEKMYRMPIPESQLFANKNLVQNPGWPFSPEDSE